MSRTTADKIAEYVKESGGRVFYVGGFVRDRLLSIDNKDVDIEVHGIEPDALFEILKKVGEPLTYGKSLGVFALKGEDIDIAMPRRERATGCSVSIIRMWISRCMESDRMRCLRSSEI